jgi:hypothetical protein
MRRLRVLFGLLLLFLVPPEWIYGADEPTRIVLELDQMLTVRAEVEFPVATRTAVRAGGGVSVLGFPLISYSAVGVYHLRDAESPFQLDLEGGMPLAYFNFFEGECIDWDPHIDDPFAGWLYGGGLSWGRRMKSGQISLFTGLAAWWEWQRDTGWKGPEPMALVSLRYGWEL